MAWYVSHCNTNSKREKYIEELTKYLPIDIYGACGRQFVCGSNIKNKTCVHDLLEEYKFYFAGENSICKEYFTGRT